MSLEEVLNTSSDGLEQPAKVALDFYSTQREVPTLPTNTTKLLYFFFKFQRHQALEHMM